MSWEGYNQNICANGHMFNSDALLDWFYDGVKEQEICPYCKAPKVWTHVVDETNGYEAGNQSTYPMELEELTPAKFCNCTICGNTHMIAPPTYKIPEPRES